MSRIRSNSVLLNIAMLCAKMPSIAVKKSICLYRKGTLDSRFKFWPTQAQQLYSLVPFGYYEDLTAQQISENADYSIRLKTAKRSVPQDLWAAYGRFVKSVTEKNGVTHWVRDTSKIDETIECSGYFALRSNAVTDAFEALSIYRQRNMVEQDFYQLKNWLDGDRLHVGAVSVQDKLLVNTIGIALRMMMLCRAKQKEDRKSKLILPGGSWVAC